MKVENRLLLERVAGIIEGVSFGVADKPVAEALVNAVEMIDSVIEKESEGEEN